jgi:phosphatidylethanolamine-binding protein (PEBP) family uncharacterized protein
MVTGIPADVASLAPGASGIALPPGVLEHVSTFGTPGYGGPQPPKGSGNHEYEAVLYALDVKEVDLAERATLEQFKAALAGHVLATARCSGLFGR